MSASVAAGIELELLNENERDSGRCDTETPVAASTTSAALPKALPKTIHSHHRASRNSNAVPLERSRSNSVTSPLDHEPPLPDEGRTRRLHRVSFVLHHRHCGVVAAGLLGAVQVFFVAVTLYALVTVVPMMDRVQPLVDQVTSPSFLAALRQLESASQTLTGLHSQLDSASKILTSLQTQLQPLLRDIPRFMNDTSTAIVEFRGKMNTIEAFLARWGGR